MDWVAQEDAYGCGVASLAMVTGKTYSEVKAYFTADGGSDFSEGGRSSFDWDQYLCENGYATARMWPMRMGMFYREVWPPEPFGDVHLCEVWTDHGGHMVVLLRDGTVLDPATPTPRRLSDYERVLNVAAVARIAAITQEAL